MMTEITAPPTVSAGPEKLASASWRALIAAANIGALAVLPIGSVRE